MSRLKAPMPPWRMRLVIPGRGLPKIIGCRRGDQREIAEHAAMRADGGRGDDGGLALQQIVCVEPSERADGRAVAGGRVVAGDEVEEPEQLLFPVGADLLT